MLALVKTYPFKSVRLFAMDAYEVYQTILNKYILFHANIVGHNPRELKSTFVTYIAVSLWYSFSLMTLYTIWTSDREQAIFCLWFFIFSTQVIVLGFQFKVL